MRRKYAAPSSLNGRQIRLATRLNLNSFDIWQIWGIETLVRHLTHVQIDVTRSGTADRQGNEQTGLTGWFPQLFHNSPHILSLSIGFHDVPFWPFKTGPRTMMKLPLQCLTLKTVKIGDFEVFCEQLAASCPGLRQLRIPDHSLVLSELFLLTRLKQLESLNVRVEFLGLPERAGLSWEHSAGALTSLEYENIPLASNPKKCDPNITASEIAGYLLTIWPHLVYFAPAIGSNACWATPVHRDVTRIIPRVRAALECSCSLCTRRTNQT
ncbi:hypothetical protein FRC12_004647 [Ceratobasidium sp. 428]|nr:hypothetical protein FRC12_004647 [Ceratobasidium sp. 428]